MFIYGILCFFLFAIPGYSLKALESWKNHTVFLSGGGNPELAKKVSEKLGVPLIDTGFERFKNGEICVHLKQSVGGKNVFIISSFVDRNSLNVNDFLMELFLIADASTRSGAENIYVVLLNYPYARQDRKNNQRSTISASLVAKILEQVSRVKRVVTVDLHSASIQGFFQGTGVDNLDAAPLFAEAIQNLPLKGNLVAVSPDAGGVRRTEIFQENLKNRGINADLAIMIKKRLKANEIESVRLVGNVKGKTAIIVDDICDTGNTLVAAAQELRNQGATQVYACITHPIFSDNAITKIQTSTFEKVFVTDSIPSMKLYGSKIVRLSLAPMLAAIIQKIAMKASFLSCNSTSPVH